MCEFVETVTIKLEDYDELRREANKWSKLFNSVTLEKKLVTDEDGDSDYVRVYKISVEKLEKVLKSNFNTSYFEILK
jgi:cobalamin biosynthesis Co2+ chelatase CbiK